MLPAASRPHFLKRWKHFNAGSSLATNRMAGCLLSPLTCSNQEPPGTAAKAETRWDDNSPDRAKCQSSAKALRVFLYSGKWPDRSGGEEHCSQRRPDRSALVSGGDLDRSLHAVLSKQKKGDRPMIIDCHVHEEN